MIQQEIFLNEKHAKVFMEASHDRNPLHINASYASRTFFGETVFYGMGGVFMVLSIWAKGRFFRLLSIQGSFHRPLLIGSSYQIEIVEEGSSVTAKILDHGQLMTKLIWRAVIEKSPQKGLNLSEVDFGVLKEPADPEIMYVTPNYRKYSLNKKALIRLEKLYGLLPGQMVVAQITTFLWASYFVGMEYPGRRALFSDFAFEFKKNVQSCVFEVSKLESTYNSNFNFMEITGGGTCLNSFKLSAYRMPEIVNYPISDVISTIKKSQKLKNKAIFISGAARGFGSVLAKILALHGATVLLNCRKIDENILKVKKEINLAGGICHVVEMDLSSAGSAGLLYKKVSRLVNKLDWIINNASPRIPHRKFTEQTTQDFLNFVDESLSIPLNTCHSLLPILNNGGWVFGISSTYLDIPQKGFSHYIASKSALEGFLLGLSEEYKKINFAVFRAPRMLTDQTNAVAGLSLPVSAIKVGEYFLDALNRISTSSGNFHRLDIKAKNLKDI